MTFLNTNTEIPDELIRAHQEGRVVFFCGAGISRDAQIVDFKGLLEETARRLKHTFTSEERALLKAQKYEQLYQLLEMAYDNKACVRRESAKLLSKEEISDKALRKHKAILKLSHSQDKKCRLVTTNYDSLFDLAATKLGYNVANYKAPLLPVPKKYKWNGIVYLHGKLDADPSDENLNSLVISSGDFGLAYLTERWASRFVTDLLRGYIVCFVGYSVNDVIVKYMMDALSSEALMGEGRCPVYAFSGAAKRDVEKEKSSWTLKGITPIVFQTTEARGYEELTDILVSWSEFYGNGWLSTETIVRDTIGRSPSCFNPNLDSTISQLIWALESDIGRAVLSTIKHEDDYKWIEHLPIDLLKSDDGRLMAWIAERGEHPESLQWFVRGASLMDFDRRQRIYSIISSKPISDGKLRCLWHYFLDPLNEFGRNRFLNWSDLSKGSDYANPGYKREFMNVIRPRLELTGYGNAFSVYNKDKESNDVDRFMSWDVVVGESVCVFQGTEDDCKFLSAFLLEITSSIAEVASLRKLFHPNDYKRDYSYFSIPSLFSDYDVHYTRDKYVLLLLARDGWLGLNRENEQSARNVITLWESQEAVEFYRLYLFAAASSAFPIRNVVEWLVRHKDALYLQCCKNELQHFLNNRASSFTHADIVRLEELIIEETDDISRTVVQVDLLERMARGGARLSQKALRFIDAEKNRVEACREELARRNASNDIDVDERNSEDVPHRDWKDRFVELQNLGIEKDNWIIDDWRKTVNHLRGDQAKASCVLLREDVVRKMPVALITEARIEFALWLQTAAEASCGNGAIVELAMRIIREADSTKPTPSMVADEELPFALSMEAALQLWFSSAVSNRNFESTPFKNFLASVMKGMSIGERHARGVILQQLPSIYKLDSIWVEKEIVPLLRLTDSHRPEAVALWEHVVQVRSFNADLMLVLKEDFAHLAGYYDSLSELSRGCYAALLLHWATRGRRQPSRKYFSDILRNLPKRGLEQVSRRYYSMMQSAGKTADALWSGNFKYFLEDIWPHEKRYMIEGAVKNFVYAISFLDKFFPEAVDLVSDRLSYKLKASHDLNNLLGGADKDSLCFKYPEAALKYLSLFDDFSYVGRDLLNSALTIIAKADASLASNHLYRELQKSFFLCSW